MPEKNQEALLTVEEIQALRAEISLMHSSLAKDVVGHAPLIKRVVENFVEKGLKREWVEKLLAPLAGSTFEDDESILIAYVLEELDLLLTVEEEDEKLDKVIRIIVGGTGIGKTSLLGKLAARYTYFLKDFHKAAFINFDRQKVGAVEQLEQYSDAMDIPLIGIEDFLDEVYDVIFIDTAGSQGKNIEDLQNLIALIEENSAYKVEISLALSATSKTKDLEHVSSAFEIFPIQNYILTKLDETCDLSDIINFLIEQKKPVSYISTGQEIPEDLVVATKEYLLNQFMKDK
jgi:flagellar biosynthesis protein FlhF